MRNSDLSYHREREQHCRSMAELADDPDVRRRHEMLADLHAGRAAESDGFGSEGDLSLA